MLKTIATADQTAVILWDVPTGRKLHVLRFKAPGGDDDASSPPPPSYKTPGAATSLAWSPVNPHHLLVGYGDGVVALWEREYQQQSTCGTDNDARWAQHIIATVSACAETIAWSHDGRKFAVGDTNGHVALFAVESLTRLYDVGGRSVRSEIMFSPDDSKVLCGSWDCHSLAAWPGCRDPRDEDSCRSCTFADHGQIVRSCCFLRGGRRIISCGANGKVAVWRWHRSAEEEEGVAQLQGNGTGLICCDVWCGRLVVCGDAKGGVWMIDATSCAGGDGEEEPLAESMTTLWRVTVDGQDEPVKTIRFSVDGRCVVCVTRHQVIVCDALTGEVVQRMAHEGKRFNAVAVPHF